jgi:FtsP/CotA-like multicopper oxidase with cupredoxin domain
MFLDLYPHLCNVCAGNQWYDGTSFVSQCPILSGANFTYRFTVTEDPGTYFWHAHSGAQRVDGLSGPLIVRGSPGIPSTEPNYDEERVVFIQDWFHIPGGLSSRALNRCVTAAFFNFSWVLEFFPTC